MRSRRTRAVAAAVAALAGTAGAQTPPPTAAAAALAPTIVVTANPLRRAEIAQPADVVSGDALLVRRESTLGATLDTLPGLAQTGFGPNSSRPVIRGLDGDRVRVLDNGGASIDASSLSFDHALAIEPLVVERIEVVRGPAALLYGGNATGGVVNTSDNRIPRTAVDGLAGRAELRGGGAARERAAAALVEGGRGRFAWHADAFGRRSHDLRVPNGRVGNSAAQARGAALGGSYVDAGGFAGVAVDHSERDYGIVVAPDVTIRMRRDRAAFAAERKLDGAIELVEVQASRTRYRHDEVEGDGSVGTRFRSAGSDARVQLRHAPLGKLHGVFGWQGERLDFSALGEEAFVPPTRTRSNAVFVYEELDLGGVRFSAGARAERVRVSSAGDAVGGEGRFGAPSERRFDPRSVVLAAMAPVGGGWTLGATAGYTERAPAYYELFANGAHVASGAFERGDPTLGVERSRHAGAGIERHTPQHEARVNVYATRFSRYVSLAATGIDVALDDGRTLPEYLFRGVRARLAGAEAESRWHWSAASWRWSFGALADTVRGTNRDSGEPLPRLPPWRVQLALEAAQGPWSVGLSARRVAAQRRVPATDTPTPGYALVGAAARWKAQLAGAETTWFVRLDNLFDKLAYHASASATVRALSPLPGRSVLAGVRVSL